jgi:XTP/dITP diphosphohydrolase
MIRLSPIMKLVLATKNKGKIRELTGLLKDLPIELLGLDGLGLTNEVEETGATFAENARIKATGYARQVGIAVVADDSGLEVAALGGRPGVLSARYGGRSAGYEDKIALLLDEIEASGIANRTARFVSHIAVANADGEVLFEAEGICSGVIANSPKGTNGFGYDPIFIPDGYEQTFGELADEVKRAISHRAVAISKIIRYLRDFA